MTPKRLSERLWKCPEEAVPEEEQSSGNGISALMRGCSGRPALGRWSLFTCRSPGAKICIVQGASEGWW